MGEIFMEFRDNHKLRVAILRAEREKFFTAGWDLKAALTEMPLTGTMGSEVLEHARTRKSQ